MNKQRKDLIIRMLEQLFPAVLAVVCVLVMTLNTNQSLMAIPPPQNFEGEYSFDGGESWQVLTAESDLSADQGDLLLRGHFNYDISEGGMLYLFRDHFGIAITVNGEPSYYSIQSEILSIGEAGKKYLADSCGREWVLVNFEEGLYTTDTVEIHLQKMHRYIEKDAYRNLLDSFYVGPADTSIVQAHLKSHVTPWLIFGGFLLLVAVMLLGAALAAVIFQTSMVRNLSKRGFQLLFSGGYMILDTVILSFWSEKLVFNTYARQICMMLALYWMGLGARDMLTGSRHKLGKGIVAVSLWLNVALIIPSFLGAWAIYDTMPIWAMGQIVFILALFGAVVAELWKGTQKSLELYSCVVLLVALMLDFAGIGHNMYSHGTCTKITFAVTFVIHGFRGLIRVLIDYQGARRARALEKELEESRIAIMLSQMQPHFIYNILNVIYYMCGKDPAAAQEAISKFSDHLRNNLEALSQKELITFRRELDHIHTYLELEQIRFGEELSIVYDIEEDSFLLPVLSIQPLVENAVKHGVAKKRGGGVVTISSRQTEDAYQITVTDTGVGFDVDRYMDDGKVHVGLINVRQRLAGRMNATLDVNSEPGSGTTVTVTIPKEKVSQ